MMNSDIFHKPNIAFPPQVNPKIETFKTFLSIGVKSIEIYFGVLDYASVSNVFVTQAYRPELE